jgi:pimeloyl-ACP methyl ester carboxylesterase
LWLKRESERAPSSVTMSGSAAAPLRILCLHSFRMSGEILRRQMTQFSNFGRALADLAEFSYIDAPVALTDAEAEAKVPARLRMVLPPPYYEWWNARTDEAGGVHYDHLDATLDRLREHLDAHGPFDGLLGFSQGGSVAHLVHLLQQRAGYALRSPPRFGIFISARTSRHVDHAPLVSACADRPLALPALIVCGGKDTDVPAEATHELARTLDPATLTSVFLPDGTHRVPNLDDEQLAVVRGFLEAQQKAREV